MLIDQIEKKENALLQRTHVTATIHFTGATPSNADVSKALAEKLGVSQDLIVMRRISVFFGKNNGLVTADTYQNPEAKVRFEPKVKEKKEKKK